MKLETLKKLCCPFDKTDLKISAVTRDTEDRIIAGLLSCQHCSRIYPIVYGIPIMAPDEYREPALEAPALKQLGIIQEK